MGHLYAICGPPGAGKTTLLKWLVRERSELILLQRTTTRESRAEEGDTGEESIEYRFIRDESVFAGRLADLPATNLIEWNGRYYATHKRTIEDAFADPDNDYLLLEDIPSSIHLRTAFGSRVTVVFVFVAGEQQLKSIPFADPWNEDDAVFKEWMYRISKKWLSSVGRSELDPRDQDWNLYVASKIRRAIPDLAFIAGRISGGDEVQVLENPRDNRREMYDGFVRILGTWVRAFISHSSDDQAAAYSLKVQLNESNVPCFLDRADIEIGEVFTERIRRELPKCSHLVVILSRSALRSPWVPFEVGQAVAHGMKILPLLIEDVPVVPDYLARLHPVTDPLAVVRHLSRLAHPLAAK